MTMMTMMTMMMMMMHGCARFGVQNADYLKMLTT